MLRSRRTLVAALIAAAIGLVAGTTALAGSGSGSSGPGTSAKPGAFFAKAGGGGPAGSADCGPRTPFGDPLEYAAAYLGLSQEQLVQELGSGKSLAEIATAHGKSVDGLKQAVLDAAKAALDRAVAAGDLSADDAQMIMTKLRAGIDDLVNGKGDTSIRVEVKGAGPGAVLGGPFQTAAEYLGLSVEQVTQEVQGGKSLAEIAQEHGKSVAGLKQALFEAAQTDLEKAIDRLVNQKGLPGPECGKVVASAPAGVARVEFHVAGPR